MASATAGIAAAKLFIDAFNAQDHARLAAALNYPHLRLANGRFARIDSAAEFASGSERGAGRLAAEGWHHSTIGAIDVIHADATKVHLAMTVRRHRADGSVYNTFDTFWIATRVDDHWGIQFRSSYLGAA